MASDNMPVFDYVRRVRLHFARLPETSPKKQESAAQPKSPAHGELLEVVPFNRPRTSSRSAVGREHDDDERDDAEGEAARGENEGAGDMERPTSAADADADAGDEDDAATLASTCISQPPSKKRRTTFPANGRRPYVALAGLQLVRPFRYEQFIASSSSSAADLIDGGEEATEEEIKLDPTKCPDYAAAHSRLPILQRAYSMLHASPDTGLTRMNFSTTYFYLLLVISLPLY